jgi:hypothetical protein
MYPGSNRYRSPSNSYQFTKSQAAFGITFKVIKLRVPGSIFTIIL